MNNNYLGSIIIPVKDRVEELNRAIVSILGCSGSSKVEIIVVDDCSVVPIKPMELRPCDTVIRLEVNSGAAVARNAGMSVAKGEIIYLLDSDDWFLYRDFNQDQKIKGSNTLWYSTIFSQNYKSNFPESISRSFYFNSIFFLYPYVCQTSSLYFERSLGLRFDESLPKHQDWDFVFSALHNNLLVKKGDGEIFFDRSDKKSLSRKLNTKKSEMWINKLKQLDRDKVIGDYDYSIQKVDFHLLCLNKKEFNFFRFMMTSISLLVKRETSFMFVIKKLIQRTVLG